MSVPLVIRYEARLVGSLHVDADRFGVTYDAAWLAARDAFPISLSLPLQAAPHVGAVAHAFFSNLLPEGGARQAICARLGISIDNDVALLRAIGGECAGALSIVEVDAVSPDPDEYAYEELEGKRLQKLVSSDDVVPLLLGGPPTRLSLAGAQDKLPVAVFDGRIHLPLAGAPSTHILKLPHARFAHVPLNEAYVMGLATQIGLVTAPTELILRTEPPSLLVERYDRQVTDGDQITRLHQEDLCQALGLPPHRKYEQEGGPSLATSTALVRDHSQRPASDILRVVEWQAFNVVVGNCDGHGKNLSVLYTARAFQLAPFYDLLSTRQYPALDRKLAMSVGGRREPSELHRPPWEAFAAEVGIGARVVIDTVRKVAERCLDTLPRWTKDYRDRYGRRAILDTLPAWIARSARRVVRQLTIAS